MKTLGPLRRAGLGAALLALAIGGTSVATDYTNLPDAPSEVAAELSAFAITMGKAVQIAEETGKGRASTCTLAMDADAPYYDVRVYGSGGAWDMRIDATSGEIVSKSSVTRFPGDPVSGDWIETASGLKYFDIVEGDGAAPAGPEARVKVHYSGWLVDGTSFDSSVDRGQPITFGLNQVIAGWTEGCGEHEGGWQAEAHHPLPARVRRQRTSAEHPAEGHAHLRRGAARAALTGSRHENGPALSGKRGSGPHSPDRPPSVTAAIGRCRHQALPPPGTAAARPLSLRTLVQEVRLEDHEIRQLHEFVAPPVVVAGVHGEERGLERHEVPQPHEPVQRLARIGGRDRVVDRARHRARIDFDDDRPRSDAATTERDLEGHVATGIGDPFVDGIVRSGARSKLARWIDDQPCRHARHRCPADRDQRRLERDVPGRTDANAVGKLARVAIDDLRVSTRDRDRSDETGADRAESMFHCRPPFVFGSNVEAGSFVCSQPRAGISE